MHVELPFFLLLEQKFKKVNDLQRDTLYKISYIRVEKGYLKEAYYFLFGGEVWMPYII